MEDSQIDGLRKTKAFQIDFFVLIAVANGCKIQILNGKNLSILAVSVDYMDVWIGTEGALHSN